MFAATTRAANDAIRISILVLLPWQQHGCADAPGAAGLVLGC